MCEPTTLERLRLRLRRLKEQGRPPFEAVMSESTWKTLQVNYLSGQVLRPGDVPTGLDILGVRVRLKQGVNGVTLRCRDGEDYDRRET